MTTDITRREHTSPWHHRLLWCPDWRDSGHRSVSGLTPPPTQGYVPPCHHRLMIPQGALDLLFYDSLGITKPDHEPTAMINPERCHEPTAVSSMETHNTGQPFVCITALRTQARLCTNHFACPQCLVAAALRTEAKSYGGRLCCGRSCWFVCCCSFSRRASNAYGPGGGRKHARQFSRGCGLESAARDFDGVYQEA